MTIDQAQLRDELAQQTVANVLTVAAVIVEHSQMRPGLGSVPCPVCHIGTIDYSIAGRSRAVAARCSTAGCVAFLS